MTARTMHPLDAMTAAPDHHKVLLENDKVRVLDTRLGPGQQTPRNIGQTDLRIIAIEVKS